MEQAFKKTLSILNPNGHLLICDFFRKDVQGKSPISGGHGLQSFYDMIEKFPMQLIVDQDITEETAQSLDIMNEVLTDVVHPIWKVIAFYFQTNYPRFSALFEWKYKQKIEKAHRKYFTEQTNAKSFSHFKSYRLLVYKKIQHA